MGYRREYWQVMQIAVDDVQKLYDFNAYFRMYCIDDLDNGEFISKLGSISTILSLVSVGIPTTAVAVAGAITALLSALGTSEKGIVEDVLHDGEDGLTKLRWKCEKNPSWEMVEINAPILEFVDEGVKCIQGEPDLLRVKINGGWVN